MARSDATKKPSKTSPSQSELTADRRAVGIDPTARAANVLQLRRAKGQIEGIERMLNEDRYCADIINQIIAARASLQVVAKSLLEAHLKHCHSIAINNGGAPADQMYQELVDLVGRLAK